MIASIFSSICTQKSPSSQQLQTILIISGLSKSNKCIYMLDSNISVKKFSVQLQQKKKALGRVMDSTAVMLMTVR